MTVKVLVPDFVSIAGSFVRNPQVAGDVDAVVRARYDEQTKEFCLPAESLMLLLRHAIRERLRIGDLGVHLIFNPTGPHSDYVPIANLVLQFRWGSEIREVKASDQADDTLRLVFLGTGPAEPIADSKNTGRANTATLVVLGSSALLIDAPEGVAGRLREHRVVPNSVLITHRHSDAVSGVGELKEWQTPVFGPEKIEGLPITEIEASQPLNLGPFTVTPIPVVHSDVPAFGYHISAGVGYPTLLVIHDIAELNDQVLSRVGDIVVLDGAGWGQKIGDGHMNVLEALPLLKAHGAARIYLTPISRLVPKDASDQLPPDVFIAYDRMEIAFEPKQSKEDASNRSVVDIVLEGIEDNDAQVKAQIPWPTKPAVPFYMEHFTPDQMWEEWGKEHTPFFVEPKWNGWRIMIDGIAGRAVTESGVDISRVVPKELFVEGAVLDGELLFQRNGEIVPRHEIAAAIVSRTPSDWKPVPKIFDVLAYRHKPIGSQPYRDRRVILERIVPRHYVSPAVEVSSKDELQQAFEKMGFLPGSEGIMAKTVDSTAITGGTNQWSKVKRMLEVVVEVVSVEPKKNGFVYVCRWKDGPETGKTMVTRLRARPGDTLTVVVQELVPVEDSLRFQNAVVTGVNEREAITLEQAQRLTERFVTEHKWFYGGPMPFLGYGTKAYLSRTISELTPEHDVYVEPFVGPGGYFFLRPKVAGTREIISDIDRRKYLAFKALQNHPTIIAGLVAKARQMSVGRSAQRELRLANPRTLPQALLIALRLRMHTQRGFDDEYSSPIPANPPARPGPETYYVASLRLRGVTILNQDALAVIRKYDSPETFFYLDPPYPIEGDRYRFQWSMEDFTRLIALLKRIKGKFMLSCTAKSLKAARNAGVTIPSRWKIVRVRTRLFIPDGVVPSMEYLVMNYQPNKGAWLKSVKDRIIKLPHIKEFRDGDWGKTYREWTRKIDETVRTHRKEIPKESLVDDDEPTRGETAKTVWEERWQQYYPQSGFGQFVVQRHIRGIPENEKDDDLESLAQKHSVHLDIRFTAGNGDSLFGFTVFIPKGSKKDALRELADGKPFQCAPKLPQPTGWLQVGSRGPTWSEPGNVGATSQKYAVFEVVDKGRYSAGVWNRHSAEIVLAGNTLKGRFVFQQIRPGTWVVRKTSPEPMAQRMSEQQIADRLVERGHREFIYRDPTSQEKPKLVRIGRRKELVTPHPGAVSAWTAYIALASRLTRRSPWIKMISDNWAIVPVTNAFVDLTGDIVPTREIKKIVDQKPNVPLLLAHSRQVVLGQVVDYRRVGHFLFGLAKLSDLGQKVFRFISKHPIHPKVAPLGWGTSIGFRAQREPGKDRAPNMLHDIQLLEVSILPVGQIANPWTGIAVEE